MENFLDDYQLVRLVVGASGVVLLTVSCWEDGGNGGRRSPTW